MVKILAGNKCECTPTQRAVDKDRGEKVKGNMESTVKGVIICNGFQIADNFEMPFFEVSCKQNINIEEAFVTLARKIREQREHRGDNFDQEEKPNGINRSVSGFSLGNSIDRSRCSC